MSAYQLKFSNNQNQIDIPVRTFDSLEAARKYALIHIDQVEYSLSKRGREFTRDYSERNWALATQDAGYRLRLWIEEVQ